MLVQRFGKRGRHFKKLALGKDDRAARPNRQPKSIGAEKTFRENIRSPEEMLERLEPIAGRVTRRLRQSGRKGKTVTLKIKNHEHESSSRQTTLEHPIQEKQELLALAERLLYRPHPPKEPVRLLGLSLLTCRRKGGRGRATYPRAPDGVISAENEN